MAKSESDELNFETALANLEKIVQEMESGKLSLEESLEAFERGVKLTQRCQKVLEEAQLRVQQLMPNGDLEDEDEDDSPS